MNNYVSQDIFECIPELNYNAGLKYYLGNMDNYIRALLAILKSMKSKLSIMETMVRTEEYEGLRMILQTLRRMLSSVGASEVSDSTYQLERTLLNDIKHLKYELQEFIDEISIFTEHLEALLKQLDVKQLGKKEESVTLGSYDFTKTMESIKLSNHLLNRKII